MDIFSVKPKNCFEFEELQRIIMAIANFGIILLMLFCFSNLEYSFGKPIQGPETLEPKFKDPIDSAIQKEIPLTSTTTTEKDTSIL